MGSIERRDAVIAAVIAAGMGSVLTGATLLGSELPLKCFEAGAAADWAAAVGTWVIGLGACKLAYDANTRDRSNLEKMDSRRKSAQRAHLTLMLADTHAMSVLSRNIEELLSSGDAAIEFPDLVLTLEIAQKKYESIKWSESIFTDLELDHETIVALVNVQYGLLSTGDYIERFLQRHKDYDELYFEWTESVLFGWLRSQAAHLSQAAHRAEGKLRFRLQEIEQAREGEDTTPWRKPD